MHIVTIGGGKGQSELLRGLRDCRHEITAIVSVLDDGGSSGRLRDQYHVVPPGDLRRCFAALAADRTLYEKWNARTAEGDAVGNLEIVGAITDAQGDVQRALDVLAKRYGMTHQVVPVSTQLARLVAQYDDSKTRVVGEAHIDVPEHDARLHIRQLSIAPSIALSRGAAEAIARADVVVLTMGDLYTSLLPNLLVAGVTEALAKRGRPIVYMCNRSTKLGETHNFTIADFTGEVQRYLSPAVLTHVLADDNTVPAPDGVELVRNVPVDGVTWTAVPLATSAEPARVDGELAAAALLQLCATL